MAAYEWQCQSDHCGKRADAHQKHYRCYTCDPTRRGTFVTKGVFCSKCGNNHKGTPRVGNENANNSDQSADLMNFNSNDNIRNVNRHYVPQKQEMKPYVNPFNAFRPAHKMAGINALDFAEVSDFSYLASGNFGVVFKFTLTSRFDSNNLVQQSFAIKQFNSRMHKTKFQQNAVFFKNEGTYKLNTKNV